MVELNDQTRWILGLPNFACIGFAARLRNLGHDIERKAESEQAATIHWLLCLYENHGDKWREVAARILSGEGSSVTQPGEST